jgi:hypothetical protein
VPKAELGPKFEGAAVWETVKSAVGSSSVASDEIPAVLIAGRLFLPLLHHRLVLGFLESCHKSGEGRGAVRWQTGRAFCCKDSCAETAFGV